jgi:hypothetical protein
MRKVVRYAVLTGLLLVTFAFFYALCADDEPHGKRQRTRGGSSERVDEKHESDGMIRVTPVTNQTYREACGSCHFPYQPWLLPSGSWGKLLSNLKNHFGETVDIGAESKGVIEKYLTENAAETSGAKRAMKIMKSLKGQTPSRITDIPYIRHKHRDVSPEVFARKSVGSSSNCLACHKTADQGIYEDDDVVVPK